LRFVNTHILREYIDVNLPIPAFEEITNLEFVKKADEELGIEVQ